MEGEDLVDGGLLVEGGQERLRGVVDVAVAGADYQL